MMTASDSTIVCMNAFTSRITKEQKMFTYNPPPGVCVYPVNDSVNEYKAGRKGVEK